jgi:hypothetical protein
VQKSILDSLDQEPRHEVLLGYLHVIDRARAEYMFAIRFENQALPSATSTFEGDSRKNNSVSEAHGTEVLSANDRVARRVKACPYARRLEYVGFCHFDYDATFSALSTGRYSGILDGLF